MDWFSKNAVRAAVLIVASGLAEHAYAAIGGAVTIGASADNSTIKMTFGSFSGDTSAASASAVWGVAYVKPASDWGTSGAVEVSFQLFNPGFLLRIANGMESSAPLNAINHFEATIK